MSAQILDGKTTAKAIKAELALIVADMAKKPGLGTVLVGDDPGSHSYVGGKHKDCAEVGIHSIRVDLPATATEKDVLAAIDDLNKSPECTGYIVQLPVPKGINANKVLEAIDPASPSKVKITSPRKASSSIKRRRMTRIWSSPKAVPQVATAVVIPDKCAAMTSV